MFCDHCDAGPFRKPKYLRYHEETVHAAERSHVCPTCGASYKRTSHLKRHMQNSHSTEEIVCDWEGCGKVFKGREQYRKHMRRHETKDCHTCELCGKGFGKKRQLESHTLKIHGPFPCRICGEVYSTRKEYMLHVRVRHGQEAAIHACKYCDDEFDTSESLREHVKTDHPNFPCPMCASVFSRARDLKAHILLKHVDQSDELAIAHANKRTCTQCGVMFSSVSNLRCHMRTHHLGEKKFTCDVCGKQFAHKHVLQRHLQTVHADSDSDGVSSDGFPRAAKPVVPITTPLRVITVSTGP